MSRYYTEDFKRKIVELNQGGKAVSELVSEYKIAKSTISTWCKQYANSGKFTIKDNLSESEKELRVLRKENKQLKMEVDIFKAGGTDIGTKIRVIRENSHKYSISAMCRLLCIARSTFYYEATQKYADTAYENAVIEEFRKSRNNYGTRKLKIMLARKTKTHEAIVASRHRIGCTMAKYGLVSSYTLKLQKKTVGKTNSDEANNIVNRKWDDRGKLEVVVSDLTYVKVAGKWNYICLLLDVCERKIIGSAVGKNKSKEITKAAFYSVKSDLRKIKIFHTDNGGEFKNAVIDSILRTFGITRSLSVPGTPVDNGIAESMYSIIKTEFAFNREFASFDELELEWFDYVNWYNNVRIHGSLGYKSPAEYEGTKPFIG
ncbi:MAG: IS3 family transposase [Alphaproteobacteria bacterium]